MDIKENLKGLREQRELSKSKLAKAIQLNESVIRNIESGKAKNPSIYTIVKLCNYFKITIDAFVDSDFIIKGKGSLSLHVPSGKEMDATKHKECIVGQSGGGEVCYATNEELKEQAKKQGWRIIDPKSSKKKRQYDPPMYFQENLKTLREDHKLSRTHLSKTVGINESVLRNIESGKSKYPTIDTIVKLCNYFAITMDAFVHLKLAERKEELVDILSHHTGMGR